MGTNPRRILIAGIGNIFLGDDAFGVEVAQRLMRRPQGDGVRIADFGIRGIDLVYALLEPWDVVVLIDAMPRNHPPGTLFLVEPQLEREHQMPMASLAVEAHSMNPAQVLRAAMAMGAPLKKVLIVGCEPQAASPDEMAMGLSPAVSAAIDPAVNMVESLIARILQNEPQFTDCPAAGQELLSCGPKNNS